MLMAAGWWVGGSVVGDFNEARNLIPTLLSMQFWNAVYI